MKSENLVFRRIGAYLIDVFLIVIISMVFVYLPINSKEEAYLEVSEKYSNLLKDYMEEKITMAEFSEQTNELSYDMNKNGAIYIGCTILTAFLYYGFFAYVTEGQTLGKKLLKLKIVTKEEQRAKAYQYFIRAFLINGIIMNVVTLIAINYSRNTYFAIYSKAYNLNLAWLLIVFLSVALSASGRGFHDQIVGTKVISTKNREVEIISKEENEDE